MKVEDSPISVNDSFECEVCPKLNMYVVSKKFQSVENLAHT